jgi:hypothetical protein
MCVDEARSEYGIPATSRAERSIDAGHARSSSARVRCGAVTVAGLMQLDKTSSKKGAPAMLNLIWVIAIVLVVLWGLGLATSYTMGGMLHILLVLAVVAIIARVIMGRRG